jgi:hypothetical protein
MEQGNPLGPISPDRAIGLGLVPYFGTIPVLPCAPYEGMLRDYTYGSD